MEQFKLPNLNNREKKTKHNEQHLGDLRAMDRACTALAWQEEDYPGSHSSPRIGGPGKEGEPFLPLTLKAQIFPVISVEGTVKLGAGQLLVDGLEDSAMHWVSVIQATCPKTHPCSLLD